jgi:hypothetical protein
MPFETLRRLKELLPADASADPGSVLAGCHRRRHAAAFISAPTRGCRDRRRRTSAPPAHPSTGICDTVRAGSCTICYS